LQKFSDAIEFMSREPNAVGVFANQEGPYYDMWALRHADRCPDDMWEAMFDLVSAHGLTDAAAYAQVVEPRIFQLDAQAEPLEVDSAFGGLGIYQCAAIAAAHPNYIGEKVKIVNMAGVEGIVKWQVCEHVAFNDSMRKSGGRLFVYPDMINRATHGLRFPNEAYRTMIFSVGC
jgi:hypothetical protein